MRGVKQDYLRLCLTLERFVGQASNMLSRWCWSSSHGCAYSSSKSTAATAAGLLAGAAVLGATTVTSISQAGKEQWQRLQQLQRQRPQQQRWWMLGQKWPPIVYWAIFNIKGTGFGGGLYLARGP